MVVGSESLAPLFLGGEDGLCDMVKMVEKEMATKANSRNENET